MSYPIEQIAEMIGARRIGEAPATIDWLLTDSRSLNFPEETLFFALPAKRNTGANYIPDLILLIQFLILLIQFLILLT